MCRNFGTEQIDCATCQRRRLELREQLIQPPLLPKPAPAKASPQELREIRDLLEQILRRLPPAPDDA